MPLRIHNGMHVQSAYLLHVVVFISQLTFVFCPEGRVTPRNQRCKREKVKLNLILLVKIQSRFRGFGDRPIRLLCKDSIVHI